MVSQVIKPDIAIITDVCHNTNTPGVDKHIEGDIKGGKGGVFQYTAQNHRKLTDLMRKAADDNNISYQLEVGSFGNDTMGFFFANTVTAIIASPLKYMHTTCEMVHKKDVRNIIELFYHCLVNLTPRSWKYYDF